ncbi:MAG: CoA pyrophosphatase [bacterium]
MTDLLKNRIRDYDPTVIGREDTIVTSVLIPLLRPASNQDRIEDWSLLLQKRAEHLENQPGEICFPGGVVEHGDDSPEETACRETAEELGIDRPAVDIWGELDSMIMPWALRIHSFAGTIPPVDQLSPDPSEVDEVFTVPLGKALETDPERYDVPMTPDPGEDFPYEKIPQGKDYPWMTSYLPELFYKFNDRVVWGITARFLNRFLTIVESLRRD